MKKFYVLEVEEFDVETKDWLLTETIHCYPFFNLNDARKKAKQISIASGERIVIYCIENGIRKQVCIVVQR